MSLPPQFPIPPRLDYTGLDVDQLMNEVKTRIPFVIPEWSDFLDSNVGIVILQLVAYVSNALTYYVDKQAAETFISTAVVPKNIFRIIDLINYIPQGPQAARGQATLTLGFAHTAAILINRGLVLNSFGTNTVPFSVADQYLIPAGTTSIDVDIVQGTFVTESFTGTGQGTQVYPLSNVNAASNTLEVFIDDVEWSMVDTLVGASGSAKFYVLKRNYLGQSSIVFGNGVEGAMPGTSTDIQVTYVSTVGSLKEVPAKAINTIIPTLDVNGNKTPPLTATNSLPISGGANAETLEQIKFHAPGIFRTGRRVVTKRDYAYHVERFGGVANARVFDVNDDETIPLSFVRIYIATVPGVVADATYRSELSQYLNTLSVATIIPDVQAAEVIPVNVAMTINVYKAYQIAAVRSNVSQAITTLLAPAVSPVGRASMGLDTDGLQIGETVFISTLTKVALDVPGVASVTLTSPTQDIVMTSGQIGALGTLNINVGSIL